MRLNLRYSVILAGVLVLLVMGASLATAQDLVQEDGRINQVTHFGGDAFYCVDQNLISTNDYPVVIAEGGMRLLDSNGQELWLIPGELIAAAVAEAEETGKGALVASGRGSFGPTNLYTYVIEGNPYFIFTGYDEFGKPNSLEFWLCTPVGPVPETPGDGSSDCVDIGDKKLIAGVAAISEPPVPCESEDNCLNKSIRFGKVFGEAQGVPCNPCKLARTDIFGKVFAEYSC